MADKRDRYAVTVTAAQNDDPFIFTKCLDCDVTVFQWRSTRPFNYYALSSAVDSHESTWHTDKQES